MKKKITSMEELEELFGMDAKEMKKNEDIILSQDLEDFASCFPDWDLHPQKLNK